jgi:predicted transcriptional regulator
MPTPMNVPKKQLIPKRACRHCKGTGKEIDAAGLGAMLRRERIEAGISLRTVAVKISTSPGHLSDMEQGKRSFSEALAVQFREALK